jgi:LuxR family quorum sensing-dependent transcriptional regulator
MDYAHFAFDCIDALDRAKTPSDVLICLGRAAGHFGLDRFLTAGIPAPDKSLAPYLLMHNWPAGWVQRYVARDYPNCDPVMKKVRSSLMPFSWAEATYDPIKDPRAHAVMMEAQEFGLKTGFSVPIYTISGDQAGMTFGGTEFHDSPGARRAMHLIAIYGHQKARDLALTRGKHEMQPPKLSPRELEVLKWCSAGKTTSHIAGILSISEHTVETYITNACRKLDSVNRTQAVAQAIRARLIP